MQHAGEGAGRSAEDRNRHPAPAKVNPAPDSPPSPPSSSSLPSSSPLRLLIAGPPCSGKGTQCEFLRERFGLIHISTGDLLRAELKAGSELGVKAKEYMDAGKLLPDDLMIDLVQQHIKKSGADEKGWLLDGFPRTAVQARALSAAGLHCDAFIHLEVADDVLMKRVTGRRVDPQTGNTYHITFNPPPADIAQRCILRSDDTEESLRTRLVAYHEAVAAIVDQYHAVRVAVNGDQKKETVTSEIEQAVLNVLKKKESTA